MVAGGEIHDPRLLATLEQAGSNIVIEELCVGSRYFWNEVIPAEDRLSAIATRYMERPPCPTKDSVSRVRLQHIMNLINDYKVQGVFLIQQKFCDPHEFDIPVIGRLLKEKGIPSYFTELDVTIPFGQIRTRAEAFLEMLQIELI